MLPPHHAELSGFASHVWNPSQTQGREGGTEDSPKRLRSRQVRFVPNDYSPLLRGQSPVARHQLNKVGCPDEDILPFTDTTIWLTPACRVSSKELGLRSAFVWKRAHRAMVVASVNTFDTAALWFPLLDREQHHALRSPLPLARARVQCTGPDCVCEDLLCVPSSAGSSSLSCSSLPPLWRVDSAAVRYPRTAISVLVVDGAPNDPLCLNTRGPTRGPHGDFHRWPPGDDQPGT